MNKKETHNYKISVVMPLYNVADYLEEAIESIVNQSIGFKNNIQLILVNDGSPDNIDEICKKYLELYPENVVYLKQSNSGVSAARNLGLAYVKGKYVNFFDGDDKWANDAFHRMYSFIEKHYKQIDFVSARICFFERRSGFEHPLDYKFQQSRVIDIIGEYNCIQLSAPTSLIKSEIAKQHMFNINLSHGEDAAYLNRILLDKMAYGVVREAVYYYRKRINETSAVDSSLTSKDWYFNTTKYFYKMIIDESLMRKGYVLPYVQFLVMYEIQWRFLTKAPDNMSDQEIKKYENDIITLLNYIEDRILLEQKTMGIDAKLFALSMKHHKDISDELYLEGAKIRFRANDFCSVRNKNRLIITNLKIRKDALYIEGTTQLHILPADYSITIIDNDGNRIPIEFYDIKDKDRIAFNGRKAFEGRGFKCKVSLGHIDAIGFYLEKNGVKKTKLNPSFGKFAKLDRAQKSTYYAHGDYILKRNSNGLTIVRNSLKRRMTSELRYIKNSLLHDKKYKLILLRICTLFLRLFQNKPIWIISDRTDMARDNGEAFFSYLCNMRDNGKKYYFALDKDSIDYNRLKGIGKVLPIGSIRYKISFLNADKIVSAHADDWVINAFGTNEKYMRNLYDFDYVFLQHGIIKDDLSGWLHKTKKDISMFVTSAVREYESIVNGEYGYSCDDVVLTGLPRYDNLANCPVKKIVFMPTWRKSIAEKTLKGSSKRPYSESFKESEYFKFYNSLINDNTLIQIMKQFGYKGEFINHPAFFEQARDFTGNSVISIVN